MMLPVAQNELAVAFNPRFVLPEVCPFPYGASPWHGRGELHLGDLETCARLIPGAKHELFRRINDPPLERFFQQEFGASRFYDLCPAIYLGRAVARACRMPHDFYLRETCATHATRALAGFSGVVLRTISSERVAMWLPRIASALHDFGTCETAAVERGCVRAVRTRIPQPLVGVLSQAASYFLEDVLRRTGAPNVRVRVLGAVEDGLAHGVPTYSVRCEIRWDVKGLAPA